MTSTEFVAAIRARLEICTDLVYENNPEYSTLKELLSIEEQQAFIAKFYALSFYIHYNTTVSESAKMLYSDVETGTGNISVLAFLKQSTGMQEIIDEVTKYMYPIMFTELAHAEIGLSLLKYITKNKEKLNDLNLGNFKSKLQKFIEAKYDYTSFKEKHQRAIVLLKSIARPCQDKSIETFIETLENKQLTVENSQARCKDLAAIKLNGFNKLCDLIDDLMTTNEQKILATFGIMKNIQDLNVVFGDKLPLFFDSKSIGKLIDDKNSLFSSMDHYFNDNDKKIISHFLSLEHSGKTFTEMSMQHWNVSYLPSYSTRNFLIYFAKVQLLTWINNDTLTLSRAMQMTGYFKSFLLEDGSFIEEINKMDGHVNAKMLAILSFHLEHVLYIGHYKKFNFLSIGSFIDVLNDEKSIVNFKDVVVKNTVHFIHHISEYSKDTTVVSHDSQAYSILIQSFCYDINQHVLDSCELDHFNTPTFKNSYEKMKKLLNITDYQILLSLKAEYPPLFNKESSTEGGKRLFEFFQAKKDDIKDILIKTFTTQFNAEEFNAKIEALCLLADAIQKNPQGNYANLLSEVLCVPRTMGMGYHRSENAIKDLIKASVESLYKTHETEFNAWKNEHSSNLRYTEIIAVKLSTSSGSSNVSRLFLPSASTSATASNHIEMQSNVNEKQKLF